MTEVVLDVKLASLGVLNITPRGLTDLLIDLSIDVNCRSVSQIKTIATDGYNVVQSIDYLQL